LAGIHACSLEGKYTKFAVVASVSVVVVPVVPLDIVGSLGLSNVSSDIAASNKPTNHYREVNFVCAMEKESKEESIL
jgi:hypothetical protein